MATQAQIVTARDTAVTSYATALAAFRSAFVELAALDRVLGSPGIGYSSERPGFGPYPDAILFRHQIAAPTFGGSFGTDVEVRVTQIMQAYPNSGTV